MNIDKKIKSSITKGDIILIVCLVLITLLWFMSSFSSDNDSVKAEFYLDGEKIEEISLSTVESSYTLKLGQCELLIEKDGVSFIKSQCSDKLCVKKGKLTKKGDAMACVPEKVVVCLKSEKGKQPDSVTY